MLVQSLQITIIGMAVVFFVLAILALILKIESMFMVSKTEKKEVVKDSKLPKIETVKKDNTKVAAAISAAICTYFDEETKSKKA